MPGIGGWTQPSLGSAAGKGSKKTLGGIRRDLTPVRVWGNADWTRSHLTTLPFLGKLDEILRDHFRALRGTPGHSPALPGRMPPAWDGKASRT